MISYLRDEPCYLSVSLISKIQLLVSPLNVECISLTSTFNLSTFQREEISLAINLSGISIDRALIRGLFTGAYVVSVLSSDVAYESHD